MVELLIDECSETWRRLIYNNESSSLHLRFLESPVYNNPYFHYFSCSLPPCRCSFRHFPSWSGRYVRNHHRHDEWLNDLRRHTRRQKIRSYLESRKRARTDFWRLRRNEQSRAISVGGVRSSGHFCSPVSVDSIVVSRHRGSRASLGGGRQGRLQKKKRNDEGKLVSHPFSDSPLTGQTKPGRKPLLTRIDVRQAL